MPKKIFTVGIKAVIIKDKKILAVQHATRKTWDLPGGRIDDDESIEQALRREMREELPSSYDVSIGKIICAYRVPGDLLVENGGLMLIAYEVDASFDGPITISDEHCDVRWMTLEEANTEGSEFIKEVLTVCSQKLK